MSLRLRMLLIILIGMLVYRFFIYEPCKPPTEDFMAGTVLGCVMTTTSDQIRKEVCAQLKQDEHCNLIGQTELIFSTIRKVVQNCANDMADSQNMCRFEIPKDAL